MPDHPGHLIQRLLLLINFTVGLREGLGVMGVITVELVADELLGVKLGVGDTLPETVPINLPPVTRALGRSSYTAFFE